MMLQIQRSILTMKIKVIMLLQVILVNIVTKQWCQTMAITIMLTIK